MSTERVLRCDGPDCEAHVRTIHPPPHVPAGVLEVVEGGDGGCHHPLHFCCWDCILKYAAKFDPPTIISMGDGE